MSGISYKHVLLFFAVLNFVLLVAPSIPLSADTATIVDSLGECSLSGKITPKSKFSRSASSGLTISSHQFPGPEFTLKQPTTLKEIGAFVNVSCGLARNDPPCDPTPGGPPIIVQIRRSVNGNPDPAGVIASFVLSNEEDSSAVSYECAAVDLHLKEGTYFALFALRGFAGSLFGGRSLLRDPDQCRAGVARLGTLNPSTGKPTNVPPNTVEGVAAVRILGEQSSQRRLESRPAAISAGTCRVKDVRSPTTFSRRTFSEKTIGWSLLVFGFFSSMAAVVFSNYKKSLEMIFIAAAGFSFAVGGYFLGQSKETLHGRITSTPMNPRRSVYIDFGGMRHVVDYNETANRGFLELCSVLSLEYGLQNWQQDRCPVTISLKDEKITVNAEIKDSEGQLIAHIIENNWAINPAGVYDRNFDSTGFEVLDEQGTPVLQIDMTEENTVYIGGVFTFQDSKVVVTPRGFVTEPAIESSAIGLIRRIFIYPGDKNLGRRAP